MRKSVWKKDTPTSCEAACVHEQEAKRNANDRFKADKHPFNKEEKRRKMMTIISILVLFGGIIGLVAIIGIIVAIINEKSDRD